MTAPGELLAPGVARLVAPAKLTLSLRVAGVRADGYHLLDAEMVSLDLADLLDIGPGQGIEVVDEVAGGLGCRGVGTGPDNLVERALRAVGRRASVRLVKRIPVGAGLGGGSADAGAVLRWAGRLEPALAASIGADVPFCVIGGRARVTGIGDVLEPMPFVERRLLLLLPPLAMDTAAVYRAYDAGAGPPTDDAGNDLEAAAVSVSPALGEWRDALWAAVGSRPRLAGSGAAWFVDADGLDNGLVDRLAGTTLSVAGRGGPVLSVRTVPALVPDAALPPREAGV